MVFYNPAVIALLGGWLGPRPVAVVFVGPCWRLFFPSSISSGYPGRTPWKIVGESGGMLTAARTVEVWLCPPPHLTQGVLPGSWL